MIYPESFEQKTGFDKIRRYVADKCATEAARTMAMNASFSSDRTAIQTMLAQTSEMKNIIENQSSFPEDGYVDANRFIPKLRIDGAYLEPDELIALRTLLDTLHRIQSFFKRIDDGQYPCLRILTGAANPLPAVSKAIDAIVDVYGAVKDSASAELHNIRREIREAKHRVNARLQAALRSAHKSGIIESDVSVTVREGRIVIPVPAGNKRKLKGLVLGASASGRTVFIEPLEVIELNNEIRELEFAERREIIRILLELTDSIRIHHDEIHLAAELIAELDFIRAKARYAVEENALAPHLSAGKRIFLSQAVHPLLSRALRREGKRAVPLDLSLDSEERILLISGPNAGGKSVCLKTVGLFQYMAQCGFLITAMENSELGVFGKIFIDMGDEQSIENDLSTYSSHLSSMKYFLDNADSDTLILIDEFGTGTEPISGGAIAEAILESLLRKGAFGVITTHYSNLKYFASSSEGIFNGAMTFDTEHMKPLFKLEMGMQGSSFAFEIAGKMGIPDDIIKSAETRIGENQAGIEESLREIAREKLHWEQKHSNLAKADKRLDETTRRYEQELKELRETRKKLIAEARAQAREILAGANREIENAVRTIRESQAEKERTMEARRRIEEMKAQLNADNPSDDKLEQKLNSLREQHRARNKKSKRKKTESVAAVATDKSPLKTGEKVRIEGQTMPGEVMTVSNNNVAVAVGSLILNVNPERVRRISMQEYRNSTQRNTRPSASDGAMSVRRLNFKPYIDLRGRRASDAVEQAQELIDEALILGVHEVSILHGKGNGILKEEIRKYLRANYRDILSLSDAGEEAGGAGITIVSINN